MCKDHYNIGVTPKVMWWLVKHLIDSAWFFEIRQRWVQAVSGSLSRTYHFGSAGQRGFLESLHSNFKACECFWFICHGFTRMSVCFFGWRGSYWVLTVVHRSLWLRLWNQGFEHIERSQTLRHLDEENNKSLLPSGEGSWNFLCQWRFKNSKVRCASSQQFGQPWTERPFVHPHVYWHCSFTLEAPKIHMNTHGIK